MTFSGAPNIRSPFYKVYSSFVVRSCCSKRAPHVISKRYQSTISELNPPPKPQVQPAQKDSVYFLLLPHLAKKLSLAQRDDTYVSIRELLNHPEFRHMDMNTLQETADRDKKHSFDFQYEMDSEKERWWIRALKWNERHTICKPIVKSEAPKLAIFSTTLREWKGHISRIGIPKPRDEDIKFECTIRGPPLNVQDETIVYIHLNLRKAIKSGIDFHSRTSISDASSPSSIYTSGDQFGFIPPTYFAKVEIMMAKQTLLWGNPEPLETPFVVTSGQEFAKEGEKLSFLKQVDHVYQDFGGTRITPQIHRKTLEEARLTVI